MKKTRKAMVAAIEKKVEEKLEAKIKASEEAQKADDAARAYIVSLLQSTPSQSSTSIASSKTESEKSTSAAFVTLRSILKKVKNVK